jgi:regulatory protein
MYSGNKQYSFEEVFSKLMKYCSYQERSKLEVEQKASLLGAKKNELEKLVDLLQADNFIDEKRFAESYVRGKLKVKRWGKYKIREGLRMKGVSNVLIEKQLIEIGREEYLENLEHLVDQRKLSGKLSQEELSKQYRYFLSKGYDSDLVMEVFRKRGLLQ